MDDKKVLIEWIKDLEKEISRLDKHSCAGFIHIIQEKNEVYYKLLEKKKELQEYDANSSI